MASDEREEERLRSVALENAKSILRARQRAERELLAAKETLERKTQELAQSLALVRATLESTFDGILVTDGDGKVTGFNGKYVRMWNIPQDVIQAGEHARIIDLCAAQLKDATGFLSRIKEIYATSAPESTEILDLADGRIF